MLLTQKSAFAEFFNEICHKRSFRPTPVATHVLGIR
jgi:hypothetical protein